MLSFYLELPVDINNHNKTLSWVGVAAVDTPSCSETNQQPLIQMSWALETETNTFTTLCSGDFKSV